MKKNARLFILITFVILLFSGCGSVPQVKKGAEFPLMYNEKPKAILVLPPINNTTGINAKEYYSTTVSQPLALAGFYVIPVVITDEILKSQGMYDTEMLMDQPMNKFHEYFGADAVLFTNITSWDKSYMVISASLKVEIHAALKSTISNEVLWEYKGTIVADLSGQSSSGNPLIDLVANVVVTGINTATADYVPYAQLATTQLLQSVPVGHYHARTGLDQEDVIIDQTPGVESVGSVPAAPPPSDNP